MTEVADPAARHGAGVPALRRPARARPGVVPELRHRASARGSRRPALARRRSCSSARCSRCSPRRWSLALVELSGDPQPVAKAPTARRPRPRRRARRTTAARAAPPWPARRPRPPPTADAERHARPRARPRRRRRPAGRASTTGGLADVARGQDAAGPSSWPRRSSPRRGRDEGARARPAARSASCDSDDFSSLRKGYWVVFSGQYDSRERRRGRGRGRRAATPTRAASSRAEPTGRLAPRARPPRRQPPRRRLGERVHVDDVGRRRRRVRDQHRHQRGHGVR